MEEKKEQPKLNFERSIGENAGTLRVGIPKEICEYLQLKDGDTLLFQPETGKHGNYTSIWKKEVKE